MVAVTQFQATSSLDPYSNMGIVDVAFSLARVLDSFVQL